MTNCDHCDNPASTTCDRCGIKRLCGACYDKALPSRCCDCIMSARDCHFCADDWQGQDDAALALVCSQCISGYCESCCIRYDGVARCPQCFEILDGTKSDAELVRDIDNMVTQKVKTDAEIIREIDEITNRTSTSKITELERHLAELERIGNEGPNSIEPEPAPRRRRPTVAFAANIETPAQRTLPKRPDNVAQEPELPSFGPRTPLRRVTADAVLAAQVRRRLATKYHISKPAKWLEEIYDTKSEIIGSFTLEVLLGTQFHDSDLDICATETGATRLEQQLELDGYVCTVRARTYNEMRALPYVRHVVTWELPAPAIEQIGGSLARIQFIIMTDIQHVADYITAADITICQNRFNGREIYIGSEDTLEWRGSVTGITNITDRVIKYHKRSFRIMVPLTDDMYPSIEH